MRSSRAAAIVLTLLSATGVTRASGDFQPDAMSVQRYGPAYRYPQAGWIILHIEGAPYDRGYQHGRLLAPEILAYLRCSAALRSPTAPEDGWRNTRSLINALFLRRYDREFLEEMKGIADGATAAGARFHGRPIDLVDVVGLNAWPELDTLDSALEATPTGLEGMRFPHPQPRAMPDPKAMHCSAFAATGPATADGKIVFGHITMFGLYPSLFYNVWLDVKPAHGHRVFMQTFPGGIQSGLDYYFNDAGLLVCETTLAQTRFDVRGMALASRIRQALQYADSIDRAAEILTRDNNGLYTNEWLLGDVKTNEIAMLELGTARTKLYRSSKNEWFGGTEGFYWGCNNTKDIDVRLETIPSVHDRPANMVWHPSPRDKTWLRLYREHRGRIDADFGKLAFTTPPLAAHSSLDAKFTTSDMARELKTWALFGPPLGRSWEPTPEERKRFPEIRPMVSNPWTILHAAAPPQEKLARAPVDLSDRVDGHDGDDDAGRRRREAPIEAVWHGTVLPRSDADTWLAAAFADYHRVVALEKSLRQRGKAGELDARDRERLAVELFAARSDYLAAARATSDTPLAEIHADIAHDEWYRIADGKGVLLLHELRRLLGTEPFEKLMDRFGREHAGKQVATADFIATAEQAAGKPLAAFFDTWLKHPGLPALRLDQVATHKTGPEYEVHGLIRSVNTPPGTPVDVTVETAGGQTTGRVTLTGAKTAFSLRTHERPTRVVVDRDNRTAKANGGPFSVFSFHAELPRTLIVYGTADEESANRETAEALQRRITEFWSNYTVPVKKDRELTDEEARSHHLLLIGRPDSNPWVARFRAAWPIRFGSRSFTVGTDGYAHAESAVIAAAPNPRNGRFSVVVLAGLSAEATRGTPNHLLGRGGQGGEVVVIPHAGRTRTLVVPAKELVHDLTAGEQLSRTPAPSAGGQ